MNTIKIAELQEIARRAQMLLDSICDYELQGYDPVSSGAELNAVTSIRDKARKEAEILTAGDAAMQTLLGI